MKPELQRIAIAEACGWRFVINPVTKIGGYWEQGRQGEESYKRGDWGSRERAVDLPDYLSDLNAMHEAEKVLRDFGLYVVELGRSVDRSEGPQKDHNFAMVTATAPQRTEAFLRTLNLWKD